MQFHFDTTKGELLEVDTNVSQVKSTLLLMTIRKLWLMIIKICMQRLELQRVIEWIIFELMGYWKRKEKIGMEVRPKLNSLPKKKKGIENVEIECAQRMGKEQWDDASQKRTIIDTFFNYKDRENVLPEYRSCKLWQEMLYINEGSSKGTMEIRTELFKQAKELKKKGKFEKVIHNRLL